MLVLKMANMAVSMLALWLMCFSCLSFWIVLKLNMSATGCCSLLGSSCWSFLVLLLSALPHLKPSQSYSLKNCSVEYSLYDVTWIDCSLHDLIAVPDDIPANAVSLNLNTNHILKINRTDLSGLLKLRYLQLGYNWISHVDDGAFVDLNLKNLDMGSNNLSELTDNMFEGLRKLLSLSLERNRISHISPRAFRPLISLQSVKLMYNHMYQIANIVPILQLPNLYELMLGSNRFSSFQSHDLPFNKSNLRTLWLNGNSLKQFSISRDVFPRLQSLHLSCAAGFQWDVPDSTFLSRVMTLGFDVLDVSADMYRAMLKTVESVQSLSMNFIKNKDVVDIACQSPALLSLDLSSNHLVSINQTLLQACSQLTELDLSSNSLEELSEFSLRSMKQLNSLNLHNNSLSRVPPALRGHVTLHFLDLSFNVISDLGCFDFSNLTGLRNLSLNHNHISTLNSCVFQGLKDLIVLNIAENNVHTLVDFSKVNLEKLVVLDLHKNDLKQLQTGDFRGLSSLSSLDLESKKLCTVENGTFEGLHNLQRLSVTLFLYDGIFTGLDHLKTLILHLTSSFNKSSHRDNDSPFLPFSFLETLEIRSQDWHDPISPQFLKGLKSLEHLTAEKFFATSPHVDTFKYTPSLRSLAIIQSDLQDLNPELLQPIQKLQVLNLSRTKLRSLAFLSRLNLSALTVLTLKDNNLMVIHEMVFQLLPALTYLDLSGNPFTCSCANAGFIQWLKNNNQSQVDGAYQYDCSPAVKQGTKLLDTEIQSCQNYFSYLCFLCLTVLIVLALFTSFIYHFLRQQLVYAFYLFLAFLYDIRKRERGAPQRYDAFVSYSIEDEAWVYGEMLVVLEEEQGWKLCLHHRDFQPGKHLPSVFKPGFVCLPEILK